MDVRCRYVRQQIIRRAGGEQQPSSWGQYTDRHVVESVIHRLNARVSREAEFDSLLITP